MIRRKGRVSRKKQSTRKSVCELIKERVAEMLLRGPNDRCSTARPNRNGVIGPVWSLVNQDGEAFPKAGTFRLKCGHLDNKATDSKSESIEMITGRDFGGCVRI